MSSGHEGTADICEFTAAGVACRRSSPSPPSAEYLVSADGFLGRESKFSLRVWRLGVDYAPVHGLIPMSIWTPPVSDMLYIYGHQVGEYTQEELGEKCGGGEYDPKTL